MLPPVDAPAVVAAAIGALSVVRATLSPTVLTAFDPTVVAAFDPTVVAAFDPTVVAAFDPTVPPTLDRLVVLSSGGVLGTLESIVESATGWVGLVVIWVYSFLIAFLLPGPSEIVLLAPLNLGLPYWATLALIMLVSGVGKAAGSLLAFHIGQEAKEAGPIIRWLRRSRFDVVEWSERTAVQLAQRWGYVGLALALSVPLFPDTISIYAFAVLEEDYVRFALATFAGSVGRLLVTIFVVGGVAITI